MAHVQSGDLRIHYRVEGAGPPLVLAHGFGDSLESWYEYGYVRSLSDDHRLILIDARGHGASDKPLDPAAYGSALMVGDIVSVLDACGVEKSDFYGYSMGGDTGLEMATLRPERLRSLIAGGASPVGNLTDDVAGRLAAPGKLGEALLQIWDEQAVISPALRSRLSANDWAALSAYGSSPEERWVAVDDVASTFE